MKSLVDKIYNKFKYAFLGLWDGICKDKSIQIQWFFAIMDCCIIVMHWSSSIRIF